MVYQKVWLLLSLSVSVGRARAAGENPDGTEPQGNKRQLEGATLQVYH